MYFACRGRKERRQLAESVKLCLREGSFFSRTLKDKAPGLINSGDVYPREVRKFFALKDLLTIGRLIQTAATAFFR